MKKYLLILTLVLFAGFAARAQDDDNGRGKQLQEKMKEYIQKRLNLSKGEAEKFSPVFLRYIIELRRTHRENAGDRLILQQRIAEIRVRFRDEFKTVLDEPRANRVFDAQREFENIVKDELKNRRMDNGPIRRNNR